MTACKPDKAAILSEVVKKVSFSTAPCHTRNCNENLICTINCQQPRDLDLSNFHNQFPGDPRVAFDELQIAMSKVYDNGLGVEGLPLGGAKRL